MTFEDGKIKEVVERSLVKAYAERNTSPKMPIEKKYVEAFVNAVFNCTDMMKAFGELRGNMDSMPYHSFDPNLQGFPIDKFGHIVAYSMLKKDMTLFQMILEAFFGMGSIYLDYGKDELNTDENMEGVPTTGDDVIKTDEDLTTDPLSVPTVVFLIPIGKDMVSQERYDEILPLFEKFISVVKPVRVMIKAIDYSPEGILEDWKWSQVNESGEWISPISVEDFNGIRFMAFKKFDSGGLDLYGSANGVTWKLLMKNFLNSSSTGDVFRNRTNTKLIAQSKDDKNIFLRAGSTTPKSSPLSMSWNIYGEDYLNGITNVTFEPVWTSGGVTCMSWNSEKLYIGNSSKGLYGSPAPGVDNYFYQMTMTDVTKIYFLYEFNSRLYIGTNKGLWYIENGGTAVQMNNTLKDKDVYCACSYNNELYVGANVNGSIFKVTDSSVTQLTFSSDSDMVAYSMRIFKNALHFITGKKMFRYQSNSFREIRVDDYALFRREASSLWTFKGMLYIHDMGNAYGDIWVTKDDTTFSKIKLPDYESFESTMKSALVYGDELYINTGVVIFRSTDGTSFSPMEMTSFNFTGNSGLGCMAIRESNNSITISGQNYTLYQLYPHEEGFSEYPCAYINGADGSQTVIQSVKYADKNVWVAIGNDYNPGSGGGTPGRGRIFISKMKYPMRWEEVSVTTPSTAFFLNDVTEIGNKGFVYQVSGFPPRTEICNDGIFFVAHGSDGYAGGCYAVDVERNKVFNYVNEATASNSGCDAVLSIGIKYPAFINKPNGMVQAQTDWLYYGGMTLWSVINSASSQSIGRMHTATYSPKLNLIVAAGDGVAINYPPDKSKNEWTNANYKSNTGTSDNVLIGTLAYDDETFTFVGVDYIYRNLWYHKLKL